LAGGDSVVVLDNFLSGTRANLEGLTGDLNIVEGSVTVVADVERAAEGCDGIFHLAAVPSVVRSVEEPLESHEVNTMGSLVVLDVARRHGIKVVYAGSSSAYGDQPAGAVSEDLRESPLSPYAADKLAGELSCRAFANVYGLPVVVTRFFNVYGPRQVPDSPYSGVVAAFAFALLRDDQPVVHGDGLQSRDFTFVEDVASGCLLAMATKIDGCRTINLACGGSHSVVDILAVLKSCAGSDVEPRFTESRAGDIKNSCADTTRARELLGFEPKFSLAEGLEKTYDWYRSVYA
jgi:nucleoside-diphosphate-sugar epimerase